ncbi:hypothetical protein RDWZM_009140 [Blomia tropicalis]|uniref:Uncharacterized protein n=1 Tax=Blomia tropicalis TaxID=40697 RepID=A0A9Q0M0U1_BLOTA|nr:hypothetical protein RDWZM_009140 [Blomia tropicalis]
MVRPIPIDSDDHYVSDLPIPSPITFDDEENLIEYQTVSGVGRSKREEPYNVEDISIATNVRKPLIFKRETNIRKPLIFKRYTDEELTKMYYSGGEY